MILTTAANAVVQPVHDRMPVLLSPDGAEAWPTRGDRDVLVPAPESWLASREVSARVNAVANEGPELLESPDRSGSCGFCRTSADVRVAL